MKFGAEEPDLEDRHWFSSTSKAWGQIWLRGRYDFVECSGKIRSMDLVIWVIKGYNLVFSVWKAKVLARFATTWDLSIEASCINFGGMNNWRYDWVIASSIDFGQSCGRRISPLIWDHDNQNTYGVKCSSGNEDWRERYTYGYKKRSLGSSKVSIFLQFVLHFFSVAIALVLFDMMTQGRLMFFTSCSCHISQRVMAVVRKVPELLTAVDGKGTTDVEMAKQHGTRKRLLKPTAGTAVSTKMRMASVRASPRKRTGVKSGMRQGGNSKQMDAKGTSNPKPRLPKP
ncbi:LOW QUALITY PROTEIN: hypothetical protein HID58_072337 [Brassica napus]|uniref:Uncharacterized protein n=1 Tax=Brassica napus TaxID=3708 RepID=A0ABQ7Z4D1_BRANA|nr:LOW QUALITY PROTEIN: hypothetical protein HID58_072337 [Brassica napus]